MAMIFAFLFFIRLFSNFHSSINLIFVCPLRPNSYYEDLVSPLKLQKCPFLFFFFTYGLMIHLRSFERTFRHSPGFGYAGGGSSAFTLLSACNSPATSMRCFPQLTVITEKKDAFAFMGAGSSGVRPSPDGGHEEKLIISPVHSWP